MGGHLVGSSLLEVFMGDGAGTKGYLDQLAAKLVQYFQEHKSGPVPEEFRDVDDVDFYNADVAAILNFLARDPHHQKKAADLLDYSPSRWLLAQEIPAVKARREIHERPDIKFDQGSGDPYDWARKSKLQGICFSGGGIRSATFNLGVLQGLAKLQILNHFDYLSSVSGGGYIHEWLAAWIKRAEREGQTTAELVKPQNVYKPGEGFRQVEARLVPLPSDSHFPVHPEPIRWLRRYSNYLTPQKGLFTADTWVAIAIWLRNTFLNQLILVSALFALLLIPNGVAQPLTRFSVTWSVVIPFVLVFFAGAAMARELRREYSRIRFLDNHPDARQSDRPRIAGGEKTIQALVVIPLLLACALNLNLLLPWIPRNLAAKLRWCDEIVVVFVLLWVFMAAMIASGASVDSYIKLHNIAKPAELWRRLWRILRIAVNGVGLLVIVNAGLSAIAGTLLLIAVHWAMCWHLPVWAAKALGGPEPWRFQVTFGPPLLLSVPFFAVVIAAGLVGRTSPDWLREWLARVRAWALLYGFAWMIFFAIALLGPYLLSWQAETYGAYVKTIKWGAALGWVVATAGSVFAGKSDKTSGKPAGTAVRSMPLELLAKLGAYVFVLGLLLLLSVLVKSSFDLAFSQGSDLYPILLVGVPLLVFFLFGWRVDINDFSMNTFYRNRLTRCYLGASNKKRVPNPLTGFDDRDTRGMQISRLSPTAPPTATDNTTYTGPLPIICTSINLSFGEDLAWQERKAASFAFTPLYSGYHVGWTAGRRGRFLNFNGFVPTREYAFPDGGINIATAVSISGAAASPNWGYHTDPAIAFLMTMFNVRLGWWLFNPRRVALAGAPLDTKPPAPPAWPSPRFSPLELAKELLGMADDTSKYAYLSDGGHFENMGLYELVRRRCYRIVICDSEQDANYHFEGIANAIRKCRIDFGAEITLDLGKLRPVIETGNCGAHWAIGKIRYPETPQKPGGQDWDEGIILYIKSSLTGASKYQAQANKTVDLPCETVDIINFKFTHDSFPHETTANQWFTESQFESYRRLGYHVIDEIKNCEQWQEF